MDEWAKQIERWNQLPIPQQINEYYQAVSEAHSWLAMGMILGNQLKSAVDVFTPEERQAAQLAMSLLIDVKKSLASHEYLKLRLK